MFSTCIHVLYSFVRYMYKQNSSCQHITFKKIPSHMKYVIAITMSNRYHQCVRVSVLTANPPIHTSIHLNGHIIIHVYECTCIYTCIHVDLNVYLISNEVLHVLHVLYMYVGI